MLEGSIGPVEDPQGILGIVVKFYKNLFGFHPKINVNLMDNFWAPSEMVNDGQNSLLGAEFTEDIVFGSMLKEHLVQMNFTFLFFQQFWELIKKIS